MISHMHALNARQRRAVPARTGADRTHRNRSPATSARRRQPSCSVRSGRAGDACRAGATSPVGRRGRRARRWRIAPRSRDRPTVHTARTAACGTTEESTVERNAREWPPCGKNCCCRSPGSRPAAECRNRGRDRETARTAGPNAADTGSNSRKSGRMASGSSVATNSSGIAECRPEGAQPREIPLLRHEPEPWRLVVKAAIVATAHMDRDERSTAAACYIGVPGVDGLLVLTRQLEHAAGVMAGVSANTRESPGNTPKDRCRSAGHFSPTAGDPRR